MKTPCLAIALLVSTVVKMSGQAAGANASATGTTHVQTEPAVYTILERGADRRVWQATNYQTLPSGETVPKIHNFTELQTGMHFLQNGRWLESKEEIVPVESGGASATQGPHKVHFPYDIYRGVVELVTLDGQHLKSRPVGLAYCDGTNNVMIADLTNSVGRISGNKVIYANAFTDFEVDLVCTYRKNGFESDVIIRHRPPNPEEYGLNPNTTRLQLFTEFFDTAEPVQILSRVSQRDGLQDRSLQFGSALRMVHGKAFSIGDSAQSANLIQAGQMPVYKSWEHLEGRTFLIEELPFKNIASELQKLASLGSPSTQKTRQASLRKVAPQPLLPPKRLAQANTRVMQQAKADLIRRPGVVLDYTTVSALTGDYTFQANQTYLVNGEVDIVGTATFEGGTVVKYDTTNAYSYIQNWGNVVCATAPYRPAIFTSRNDDTVGELMSVTNTPMTYYHAFGNNADGADVSMHDIRVSYAYYGLHPYAENFKLSNAQFLHCHYALYPEFLALTVNNILMSDVYTAFGGANYALSGSHITIDGCTQLTSDWYDPASSSVSLTNCLLVNVSSNGYVAVATNHTERSSVSVFQSAGGGNYYLTNGSAYRNAGTTSIDPAWLADIRTKTTYPPLILTNTITVDTNLVIQAQRDTDTPDLGYHYDPLDYFASCVVTNAAVTLTNGVAVAYNYSTWSSGGGFLLQSGSNFVSQGTALLRNYIVHHSFVQEGPAPLWTTNYSYHTAQVLSLPLNLYHSNTNLAPGISLRDTTIVVPAGSYYFIYSTGNNTKLSSLSIRDCEFHCGNTTALLSSSYPYDFQNNLFVYPNLDVENSGQVVTRNNFLIGDANSYAYFANYGSAIWTNRDNAYDGCDTFVDDTGNGTNGYNAYLNGAIAENGPYTGDIVTNINWLAGSLGNYYQATNGPLINKGSRTADLAGLYHYTVTTNLVSGLQIKETNSIVDIGYHYVAVDANGNPIDTDGDGIPDYLEDANGNGVVDGSETSWILNNYNGLSFGSGLQVFTPLK